MPNSHFDPIVLDAVTHFSEDNAVASHRYLQMVASVKMVSRFYSDLSDTFVKFKNHQEKLKLEVISLYYLNKKMALEPVIPKEQFKTYAGKIINDDNPDNPTLLFDQSELTSAIRVIDGIDSATEYNVNYSDITNETAFAAILFSSHMLCFKLPELIETTSRENVDEQLLDVIPAGTDDSAPVAERMTALFKKMMREQIIAGQKISLFREDQDENEQPEPPENVERTHLKIIAEQHPEIYDQLLFLNIDAIPNPEKTIAIANFLNQEAKTYLPPLSKDINQFIQLIKIVHALVMQFKEDFIPLGAPHNITKLFEKIDSDYWKKLAVLLQYLFAREKDGLIVSLGEKIFNGQLKELHLETTNCVKYFLEHGLSDEFISKNLCHFDDDTYDFFEFDLKDSLVEVATLFLKRHSNFLDSVKLIKYLNSQKNYPESFLSLVKKLLKNDKKYHLNLIEQLIGIFLTTTQNPKQPVENFLKKLTPEQVKLFLQVTLPTLSDGRKSSISILNYDQIKTVLISMINIITTHFKETKDQLDYLHQILERYNNIKTINTDTATNNTGIATANSTKNNKTSFFERIIRGPQPKQTNSLPIDETIQCIKAKTAAIITDTYNSGETFDERAIRQIGDILETPGYPSISLENFQDLKTEYNMINNRVSPPRPSAT